MHRTSNLADADPCRRRHSPHRLAWLLGLICLASITTASARSDPDRVVQSTLASVRDAIVSETAAIAANAQAARQLIRRTLIPRVDTRATARYVLAQQWGQAQPAQQEAFHRAFHDHAVATYGLLLHRFADRVAEVLNGLRFSSETVRQNEQTALVRTTFQTPGGSDQTVRIHLHARDGEWLLFDAEYAGFSLLSIWRAEIQGRLGRQALPELITSLRERHSDGNTVAPGIDEPRAAGD